MKPVLFLFLLAGCGRNYCQLRGSQFDACEGSFDVAACKERGEPCSNDDLATLADIERCVIELELACDGSFASDAQATAYNDCQRPRDTVSQACIDGLEGR